MREAGVEPTTFGSGGANGQRPPTLAGVVSGAYASRALTSGSQRRPRCYRRCYHEFRKQRSRRYHEGYASKYVLVVSRRRPEPSGPRHGIEMVNRSSANINISKHYKT
jgi:hypothetical protein